MYRTARSRRYLAPALFAAALLAVGVVVSAHAGVQFTVNSTADALDSSPGDGECRTAAGACTLRAAIQEANALPGPDEIRLPTGTYALGIPPRNQNDIATGDLDITGGLTISGAGAGATFVDGNALDRLFEVAATAGTVAFSGLTLREGSAQEYGGAIFNGGGAAVTVDDSALSGNVAEKTGGAIDNHAGGELHVSDSTLTDNFARDSGSALNNNRDGAVTITNSTISSNSAADVGLDDTLVGAGAVSNNAELDAIGTIAITGSQFADNRAGGGRSGTAISNDGGGSVAVEDTTFSKNQASAKGGAIFNGSGVVTVADSRFAENAAVEGGAVYSTADKGGRVSVRESEFVLNSATGNGGAIVGSGTGELEVLDSTFSKNTAGDWGGAVSNDNKGSATILRSSFSENSALNGGGFGNEGSGLVVVDSTTFSKNAAVASAVLESGEGGGMSSNSGGELVISGGLFTDNKARGGGGLSNGGGGTVAITGTRFTGNSAEEQGGGLLIESGAVSMLDIDVVGNVADGAEESGGGISYAGDKAVGVGETAAIEQSRIRDNKAKGPGGGIDSRGDGPLTITTTSITGNGAATGGAVHHVGDAPLEISRSTLSGNLAENGGGVYSDGDGEATVENTTVSSNRAGQFGGGLLVSSRLHLKSSTVAGNTAASGGGINNGGGDLVGDGSVLAANTIVAASPTGGNCAGTMTSLGGNIDSANSCQFRQLTDQPGTDPRLGSLAGNGGPTQTHALLAGSPAQERAVCTEDVPCPSVDQRGVERPRFEGFDIGAYESELAPSGGSGQRCAGLAERPVPADFDSWVSQSAAASNFGSDSILKVESRGGGNQRALVHFDLPPVPPGCRLVSATLRLYSAAATEGRTLEAVRIASGWSELGVSWAGQPAAAGPAATTGSGLDTREWDVLDQTLDMYAHGEHGFLIRDAAESGSGQQQSFHSGEKGPEHPPELVLVFDDPDPSPRAGTCPTTPQSLSADRDSWVNEGSPANNFGNDTTLKVKSQGAGNARALVRFPLPALPAGCTGVASARLRVDAASAKEGRTLEAVQAASAWTETGVTWAGQPGTTGPVAAIPSAEGPLEWEVTEQVLGMYTSANHGFVIRDSAENGVGDEQTLTSRHKPTDGPPELVLVFDDSTPETAIDDGPANPTDSTEATFAFSSDRGDATFECSLDGAAFSACSSPHPVDGLAEGDHVFEVRASRRVRAVDPTPASYSWKVAVPPKSTVSGPASPSSSPDATVTFSADDPEATFECSLNGAAFAGCTSPAEYTNLADGPIVVRVRATDRLGNVEPAPASHAWTVAVPPDTTIASGPPALGNSRSASFEFGGTDNGLAPPPLEFECRLDAGEWSACSSPQAYAGLADGRHTFEVQATDAAGNREAEPAARIWTVDTAAPQTTIESGPPELTNSSAATFGFRADEAGSFECNLDGAGWSGCASPHEISGLADGKHTFEARATDRAGNLGAAASRAWTVDTVAPDTTVGSGPPDPSASPDASFEFGADEPATFECRRDEGEWVGCTSPHELSGLADGEHTFRVQATDTAGNRESAPALFTWTVDTAPPRTTIDAGPADPTRSAAASFGFSADEAVTLDCRLDGGDWAECTSPQSYTGLVDGEHGFEVRATDRAGNLGAAAAYAWNVDTVAPETTIESGPPDPTRNTEASFELGADEAASFECRIDGGEWLSCSSGQAYAGLADGRHTFEARATDAVGNREGEPASYVWTVDTVAPETAIDSGPADLSNDRSPRFEFSAGEPAAFECRLDAGDWVICSTGQVYAELADGGHTFEVRATDRAGNREAEPAVHRWSIDTVPPDTMIASGPPALWNATAARFEFGAGEAATFACRLDAGEPSVCQSPHAFADLRDGEHTFQVLATDRAGNEEAEAASYSWTVDTAAPETTIDSGPADPTSSTAATLEFHAGEAASFECRLDAGDWTGCVSGQSYDALADGRHTFQVRATDRAGNPGGTASHAWTVNTVAPDTAITGRPADPSNDASPSFEFEAGEPAGFECMLDTGDWGDCTSPHGYTGLADGEHTFQVRATDRAGNEEAEAAAYTWTVDTVASRTTIGSGPVDPTRTASASFEFGAGEPASFECSLDAGAWVACSSGQGYAGLADGRHTFSVRATDAAGNRELEPASYGWTVDTVAPDTTLTGQPANPTSSTSATFTFSSSEQGSTFECSLDGVAFAACASPRSYSGLGAGPHQFSVRARDAAGNLDATPAGFSWTIDTTAPQTTITSAPPATTSSTSASFGFSSSEQGSSFECSLDAAPFAACTSLRDYAGIAAGTHQFSVRARDAAGNTDATPATHTWSISAPQGCGQAATALAAADAWIDENSPTNNKGGDSILKVQSKGPRDNFRALVRFTLPVVPQGCVVESATLRLYAASAKPDRILHALRLAAPWAENQVNWGNQPATAGTAAATASGQGYREWTVTAQAQAMYAGPNHGFLIRDAVESQDSEQQLHSREKGENLPQLVVRFAQAGG